MITNLNSMTTSDERIENVLGFYFEYHHRLIDFYTIAKYCYYPDTIEERLITDSDPFFLHVAAAAWEVVVLDLCKIFTSSNSQRHNILKLLTDIKTNPAYATTLSSVGVSFIDASLANIGSMQSTIDKLKYLRDKYYAHVDDLKQDLNELKNPTFRETEDLLETLKSIIIEIGDKVLDRHYDFRQVGDSDNINPKDVIRDLVRVRNPQGK